MSTQITAYPFLTIAREHKVEYKRVLELAEEIGSSQARIDYWCSYRPFTPELKLRADVAQAVAEEARRRREGPWL